MLSEGTLLKEDGLKGFLKVKTTVSNTGNGIYSGSRQRWSVVLK